VIRRPRALVVSSVSSRCIGSYHRNTRDVHSLRMLASRKGVRTQAGDVQVIYNKPAS
jgi:hypothetical protein